jgi:ribosomal protein S18 acetylase RimI-like enzyme
MTAAERPIVQVRDIRREELPAAVALLARSFRDNPLPIATYGSDPERRRRCLETLFGAFFRVTPAQTPLVALDGGTLVGVTGIASPGTCQPTTGQLARYLPRLLPIGPRSLMRLGSNMKAWGALDPDEPHSHLGPLGVDAHLRGHGIGSQILGEYCRRLDRANVIGYLETETQDNVRLYSRFGFEVTAEQQVIGVPNWFMVRRPGPAEPVQ